MTSFHRFQHKSFGEGFLFAVRETVNGPRWTVFFPASESTKEMLSDEQYWEKPVGDPSVSDKHLKKHFRRWKKQNDGRSEPVVMVEEAEPSATADMSDDDLVDSPENGQEIELAAD